MILMQRLIFLSTIFLSLSLLACNDDDDNQPPQVIDSTQPVGAFSAQRSGTFVAENGTGSRGMAQLGTDTEGKQFLRFGSDFFTPLATGTVTVYLSTSSANLNEVFDPANGNPNLILVGPVRREGESFFRVEPAAAARFTHVILWCGSAGIPFGNAALQ